MITDYLFCNHDSHLEIYLAYLKENLNKEAHKDVILQLEAFYIKQLLQPPLGDEKMCKYEREFHDFVTKNDLHSHEQLNIDENTNLSASISQQWADTTNFLQNSKDFY